VRNSGSNLGSSLSPLMLAVLFLAATSVAQELTTEEIVARMAQAQQLSRSQAPAYIAERQYHVFKDEDRKANSEITAEISFLPPGDKTFAIKKSTGGMAENVVRKALEHESTMARNPGLGSITPDNYDFELQGKSALGDRLCYVLKIKPKRQTKDLINGFVWVDAERFMVRRAEGKPSKNPSWWVKDVQVRVEYNDVNGVWLQTRSTATAKIRLAGEYTLNSEHVRMRRAEVSAQALEPAVVHATAPSRPRINKRRVIRGESALAGSVLSTRP
jgi:outer membrane lipoprotein-sorting protein